MIIRLLFLENIQFWNILLLVLYYGFIFFALGRIVQARFGLGKRNLLISLPLGFVSYLLVVFIFHFPFIFSNPSFFIASTDSFYFIVDVFIFIIIFIYLTDWKISFSLISTNFSIRDFTFISLMIGYILMSVLFNVFFDNFNTVDISSTVYIENSNDLFSTIALNDYNSSFLSTNNFVALITYWKWFIYIIFATSIYSISNYFYFYQTKSYYINLFLSLVISLIGINIFWFFDTTNIIVLEFIILFLGVSIFKNYYSNWSKNSLNLILGYLIIATIFTINFNGIFYYSLFFISTIFLQSFYKQVYWKEFIIGSSIFFIQFLTYLLITNILIAILFSFLFLVPMFPIIINYFLRGIVFKENSEIDDSIKIKSVNRSQNLGGQFLSIFVFVLIAISLFSFISFSENSQKFFEYYFRYYNQFFSESIFIHNFLIIFFSFQLVLLLYLIFNLFINKNKSYMIIFVNAYIIFLNPISFTFWNLIFDINFYSFLLLWTIVGFDLIFRILPKELNYTIKKLRDKILLNHEKRREI